MTMNILVIRRDNIGDLVCTLPTLAALRMHYRDAWIGMLVTRYNAEVLAGNPDIDEVFTYQKSKHLAHGESRIGAMLARVGQLWRLRRKGLDLVVLPASGQQASAQRMASLVGARRILTQDDVPPAVDALHEVQRTANILRALNVSTASLPAARIVPRADRQAALRAAWGEAPGLTLGVHISARKPSQRWPADRFAELLRTLHAQSPTMRFVLFWSPGDENNPLHPGDDGKARGLMAACADLPLIACPTHTLGELIAGLSLVDGVLCSDGGHMHLAAALGKRIVALFGQSDAARWHPWAVPHRVVQPASHTVADVRVDEVRAALTALNMTHA
ncbi:MAG: glycosyltransferase family 9 protein [Rhodocyclaceae bacterium]